MQRYTTVIRHPVVKMRIKCCTTGGCKLKDCISRQGLLGSTTEYVLKKYLLLLATLVATVTYAAGLNLPGGSWLEDTPGGPGAGDSILRETNYRRYIVFYYFNAISFAASLLVGLLLLILHQEGKGFGSGLVLQIVRLVMLVDLFGLMGAYGVGSSHDSFTTTCASYLLASGIVAYGAIASTTCASYLLASGIVAYGAIAFAAVVINNKLLDSSKQQGKPTPPTERMPSLRRNSTDQQQQLEILLVLAIFAATNAYVAGLNPPGGFWRDTEEGHHTAGDPVLQGLHPRRYRAFFFLNTTAFVASLLAIILIVSFGKLTETLQKKIPPRARTLVLYGPVIIALLGLCGAYAFGSCRDSKHTTYVVALLAAVAVVSFLLHIVAHKLPSLGGRIEKLLKDCKSSRLCCVSSKVGAKEDGGKTTIVQLLEKTRENIQLLAILAATIAYQAGVDPPGGVWAQSGEGHKVGDPILLTTHPLRYKVFFYFNSAALVASLVIMMMLQNESLVRRHALEAAMILDLFGLIGAYAAGSGRDTSTSIYTVALAGAVLIYVVVHIVFFTLDSTPPAVIKEEEDVAEQDKSQNIKEEGEDVAEQDKSQNIKEEEEDRSQKIKEKEEDRLQKRRDVLLLLSVLGATLAYQAGLTPPGGFWEEDNSKSGHRAGFPVLQDKYPLRYKIFYYCNAASFMASVALIVLLMNRNLYRPGIQCYALYVCMVAGMFGLMGAYSAGSSLHLRTSIVVLVLVSVLTVASFMVAMYARSIHIRPKKKKREDVQVNNSQVGEIYGQEEKKRKEEEEKQKEEANKHMMYLMLVGVLGASVTYLTGLKPPGGMWRDDGNGHSAGYPVLYDTNKRRYNVFFYNNSTSFMASIAIIASLLSRMILQDGNAAIVLHLWPIQITMLLDMLALLGAYAAGSARKWGSSTKVLLLLVPILLIIWGVQFLCKEKGKKQEAPEHVNGGV